MTKRSVEQIATIAEGLLAKSRRIAQTRENRIAFIPVDIDKISPAYLTQVASSLVNDAVANGFCSLASLRKSFGGKSWIPDEAFEVERPNFKIGCFTYLNQRQVHLIIFGKTQVIKHERRTTRY